MKYVTVAVRMDSEFVRLLNANVHLNGLRDKDEMQPIDQLALTILAEARGGTEAEVHQTILHAWRPHFEVMSEMRTVEDVLTGDKRYIEHIDGDLNDNTPSNLRIVTAKNNL